MNNRLWLSLVFLVSCAQPPVVIDAGKPDAAAPTPKPEVLLLLDTSGSMLQKSKCDCVTAGCAECLPDCSKGERPLWHIVLAAVSGSFENYSCTTVSRDDPTQFTYDLGYSRPYQRLGVDVRQRADGILDSYKDRVQFGLATFDGIRTYLGSGDIVPLSKFDFARSASQEGLFSYGSFVDRPRVRPDGSVVGRFAYPTMTFYSFVDTGIRSASASDGALIVPLADAEPNSTIAKIKQELASARPFGGTPITSALDDIAYLFSEDSPATDGAKRYVILVSDGYPDDDFREYPAPGCDCVARGNCGGDAMLSMMSCPYPSPVDAARILHCGYSADKCSGPVARLEVISIDAGDSATQRYAQALAAAGGGAHGTASDEESLRSALNTAMQNILKDASP